MGVLIPPLSDGNAVQRRLLFFVTFIAMLIPNFDAAIVASALVAVGAFVASTFWVRHHDLPRSLSVLHVSVGLFVAGIILRIVEAALADGDFVYPGFADLVLVPAYLLAIWSAARAAMSRHALGKVSDAIDAIAVSIVAGTLALPLALPSITAPDSSVAERFVWLFYPIVQTLFLGVIFLLIFGPGARAPGLAYLIVTGLYTSVFDNLTMLFFVFGLGGFADQSLRGIALPIVTYAAATSFASWPDFAKPGVRPQTYRWSLYGVGFVVLGIVLVIMPGVVQVIGMLVFGLVAALRIGSAHTVTTRLEDLNDAQQELAAELADADNKQSVLDAGHEACRKLLPGSTVVRIDHPDSGLRSGSDIDGAVVNITSPDGALTIASSAEGIKPHHWSALSQVAGVLSLAVRAVDARTKRVTDQMKADWRSLSSSDHELVFIVDAEQRVAKATPNVETVLGTDPIGQSLPDLLQEHDLARAIVEGREIVTERDGRWLSITAQRAEQQTHVVTVRDVTARIRAELIDDVTGLNNMSHFTRLGTVEAATLIVFQVSDFSRINNIVGKAGADELLRDIGEQILTVFRSGIDQVWRSHGPSFAVLCQGPDKPDQWILDRRDLVERNAGERSDQTNFSLITAVVPIDEPIAVAEILHQADVAIAFDRAARRGGVARYSPDVAERAQRAYRIDSALAAVSNPATAGFRVHYQPIVEAGTERVARVEALLRWEHSTLGTIRPDEFIPAAERSGRVGVLDQFVMEIATQDLREIQLLDPTIHMQINLSPVGLTPERVRSIASWVRHHCDDPPSLTIEIIESAIDEDFADLLPAFHELREAGVGVSVDDFGVGHSSMERIANPEAPWTQVKLAGVFATDIHPDTVARVIDTIHSLKFEVVVENVEERAQADTMTAAGADFIQGWLFARDMPLDGVTEFITSYEMARVQGRSNR